MHAVKSLKNDKNYIFDFVTALGEYHVIIMGFANMFSVVHV